MLGCVADALGVSNGKRAISNHKSRRKFVHEPIQTRLKAVDGLVPIGSER